MAKNIIVGIVAAAVIAAGVVYFLNRRQPPPIEAGIPIYPGAQTDKDLWESHLSARDRARLVKAVTYRTTDPTAKVISFYKEQLKGKTEVLETSRRGIPSAVLRTQVGGKPRIIMITWNEDTAQTQILISTVEPAK